MVECKICDKFFENDTALHRHLRSHKVLVVDYYHAHFPRKDLHTGDLIKYKNKSQYFSEDFNDRRSMKKWFEASSTEETREYCHNYLQKRIKEKGLNYSLCEVEARSLMCPPVPFLEGAFGDYYQYCKDNLCLKNKYSLYPENMTFPKDIGEKSIKYKLYEIYVDTREQKPLKFNFPTQVQTLKFGDYCFSNPELSMNTYIERKSITDFIGTMSGGYERFKKEIERAKESNAKLIVLVEENMNNCLNFKFLPYVSKKIKATPEFIFHNVRTLLQEYDNLHFLFVKGRPEASRVIERLFLFAGQYSRVDLQLAYDLKKL